MYGDGDISQLKAIADLKNQVAELEEALEKESNKGLLSRFK